MSHPRTDRRAVVGWCLYDFANSPFTTLIVTFVYATYFTQAIAADETAGTVLWSRAVTVAAILVAVLSPLLGAAADRGGYRKRFLAVATVVAIAGAVALFFPTAGQVLPALIVFVIANVAFEIAGVFYNSFLPDVAPTDRIGRISGYGWALGYVGGLLALVVALVGLVDTETPWLGFSTAGGENVRATNLLVAVWFAVFSLPTFHWLKEKNRRPDSSNSAGRGGSYRRFMGSLRRIRKHRQIVRLLVARLIYNDGLITIFAFGGIYAAGTFGFSFRDILIFGIAINVAAGLGAYVFGFVDDRLGGKTTIMISLAGLTVAAAIAVTAQSATWFWITGMLVGLLAGPNQAASRSLLGRFVPPHMEAEVFGFYAFSGKFTAFLGPLLLGILTATFDSQRAGVAVVIVFFVVGGILLQRVDEADGIDTSGRG